MDTALPAAPVAVSDSVVNADHVLVSGTAAANSTITVYDGDTMVGTGTTNSSGNWSVTTSALSNGANAMTAKATDVAGNVSIASQVFDAGDRRHTDTANIAHKTRKSSRSHRTAEPSVIKLPTITR